MNSYERMRALVEHRPVDRAAVSGWFHMPLVDHDITDFVNATIAATDYCGWDFVKLMTNGNFMPEAYGADLTPSRDPHQWCATFHRYPIRSLEDLKKLEVLDAKSGSLHREVLVTRALCEHYKDRVPVIATIFSPLTSLQEMMGALDPTGIKRFIRENPQELHEALRTVTQTIKNYLDELIDAGIAGVFFANQYSMSTIIPPEEFDEFCKPYDLEVLNYIKDRTWFNMLHVHGDANLMMDRFLDYPAQAINWENVPSKVCSQQWTTARAVRQMTDKLLICGVDQTADFYNRDNDRNAIKALLKERYQAVAEELGGNEFVFAPGCSMPLDVNPYVFTLMKEVVEEA